MRHRRAIVPLAVVALAWAATPAEPPQAAGSESGSRLDGVVRKARSAAARPHTAAGAAASYWMARRAPLPGVEPGRALERARRQRRQMRRYSSRRGVFSESGFTIAAAGAEEWEWLGPGNIGGRTRTLVIHPRRPRIMWAGGVSGGVWKTENKGRRWRPVADDLANIAVNALAIDPSDPDVLYAGTGEGYFREVVRGTGLPLRGGGIFKSEDGGERWTRLPKTRTARFHWVNDLVVSRHAGERVYAATRKGVFRSLDGGRRWKRILNPKVTGGCLDLAERPGASGDFLFASCGTFERATVYRNPDAAGGGAWEPVLSEPEMGRTSLAVAPSNPDVVYALAASNVPGPNGRFEQALHAVFRSAGAGEAGSWEARVRNTDPRKPNTLLLSNPVIAMLVECQFDVANSFLAMGWYVNVIAVSPDDPDVVWAAGVDLFRSADGGRNWNPVTYWWDDRLGSNWVHADLHGLVFHPRRRATLFALTDGGIFRTTNARAAVATDDRALCRPGSAAVRWRSLNNNFGVTQFYHGAVLPGGEAYLGGTQDNGTLLGGESRGSGGWLPILGGDGGYSAVDPSNPRIVYASVQNGRVFRSTNGGATFEEATAGIADLQLGDDDDFTAQVPGFLFIAPLELDRSSPQRLWLGGRRLWRTDNGALSWSPASTVLASGGKVSALAVAPGDSSRVLAGTQVGDVYRTNAATSAGVGTAWESSRPRAGFVTSVTFDPGDPGTVYATYGGFGGRHVWRSGDGGATWEAIDGEGRGALPDVPAHALRVDPTDSRRLYLGTDLGVFVSLDGGTAWAVETTGFATAVTESLEIVDGGDGERYLFAFTHGRGAWRVAI